LADKPDVVLAKRASDALRHIAEPEQREEILSSLLSLERESKHHDFSLREGGWRIRRVEPKGIEARLHFGEGIEESEDELSRVWFILYRALTTGEIEGLSAYPEARYLVADILSSGELLDRTFAVIPKPVSDARD
jgi:hypothetical protein